MEEQGGTRQLSDRRALVSSIQPSTVQAFHLSYPGTRTPENLVESITIVYFRQTSQGWKYNFFVSKVGVKLDTDATFPLYIQNHEKVWQSETWVLSHFEPKKVIKSF